MPQIALAACAVYLFLAPSNWREWVGAGLVQAFIIALYAEMYVFPLTIYVLKGVLQTDIPLAHTSGHLWATLLGYGPFGAVFEMMLGSIVLVAGLLLIVKGRVQVYFHGDTLLTEGVYKIVRHPQYAGIFLVIFGLLFHWPTIPTLLLTPVIIGLYVRLARREEADLIDRYGIQYEQYQELVPMFVPGW